MTQMAGIVMEPAAREAREPGSPLRTSHPSPDWIVCRGAEREVEDGLVLCPASSAAEWVAVQTCLACRHLMASPIDRLPDAWCATD
jgi:hypothetical protein